MRCNNPLHFQILIVTNLFSYNRFHIKGIANEPKPRGPFQIKAGAFTTITFKNVFENTRMFKIYVDRDEFYVKTSYESIKSKKVS